MIEIIKKTGYNTNQVGEWINGEFEPQEPRLYFKVYGFLLHLEDDIKDIKEKLEVLEKLIILGFHTGLEKEEHSNYIILSQEKIEDIITSMIEPKGNLKFIMYIRQDWERKEIINDLNGDIMVGYYARFVFEEIKKED